MTTIVEKMRKSTFSFFLAVVILGVARIHGAFFQKWIFFVYKTVWYDDQRAMSMSMSMVMVMEMVMVMVIGRLPQWFFWVESY